METNDTLYLLFAVGKNTYGIDSRYVHAIEELGKVTSIIGSEPNIRGGLIYHDRFISLIDMRRLFKLDSQIDEFDKSVQPHLRMKEHEQWITALEASVRERTEFTLTDDPRLCDFGKWLYSFKTDNIVLKHQLNKLEAPHEAVHNTARLIKHLMRDKQYDAALTMVNELRATHYKETMRLLSTLLDVVYDSLKELFILIDSGNCTKGIIVDSIVGIEYLNGALHSYETSASSQVKFIGQRKENGAIVLIVDRSIVD